MEQALEGVKVADFTWAVVGPIMARCLADHGATVIHIESSTNMDIIRLSPPYRENIPGPNRTAYFANFNCNKYGITLNLNHPRGVDLARRIATWADVVLESYSPGTMDKWGLDYQTLKSIKPDIIMISTSAQGQTGPRAHFRAYGTQLVSLAGFTHLTGWLDRLPALPYGPYTDIIVPAFGLSALIAALAHRRRTGQGQYLDLSQYEACLHFLAPVMLDYFVNGQALNRMGNRCPYAAPHGVYPCRGDDRWCAIAIFNDQEWQRFCQTMGNPAWAGDCKFATILTRKENEEELDRQIAEWTRNFLPEEVMTLLQSAGVAAGVVQNGEDVHRDPQLWHRQHLWMLEHPEIGLHSYDSWAFKLSETPAQPRMPAPCLGQHNEYVYKEMLGFSEEEYIEYLADGVFE